MNNCCSCFNWGYFFAGLLFLLLLLNYPIVMGFILYVVVAVFVMRYMLSHAFVTASTLVRGTVMTISLCTGLGVMMLTDKAGVRPLGYLLGAPLGYTMLEALCRKPVRNG